MKLFLMVILVLVAFAAVNGQVLKVEVEGGKTIELSPKDFTKFARKEVAATAHDEKLSKYSGYQLKDILSAAGAKIGKDELRGNQIAAYVVVEATDGYRAVFSITEFSDEFTDRIILIADRRDDSALPAAEGPFQIIVPDDKKHGRWVRQVKAVRLIKLK